MESEIVELLLKAFPYCRLLLCQDDGEVNHYELTVKLKVGRERDSINLTALQKLGALLAKH